MAYVANTHPLDTCDQFPPMRFTTLDHGDVELPKFFGQKWGVVLFYRGHWCGYCRRQLVDFQQHLTEIEARHGAVIAISVDSAAHARKMVDFGHLTYPVAFGADALEVASRVGCFYEAGDRFLQKTAFVLRPGGEIARASYSTGPTGALTSGDTLYSLEFFQRNPHHRTGILRPAEPVMATPEPPAKR
jgi:peroxiredoxin